jgi:hypothetical protein
VFYLFPSLIPPNPVSHHKAETLAYIKGGTIV